MKRMIGLFLLLLAAGNIGAEESCCNCDPNSVEFRAEFLCLKPTVDQPFFVIDSDFNRVSDEVYPTGKRKNLQGRYTPGYRVEGLYHSCNDISSLDLRYTNLQGHRCKSVSGPFLFDTVGFPGNGAQVPEDTFYSGTSKRKDKLKLNAIDFTFNRNIPGYCFDNFTFLVGLHFVNIKHHENERSHGTFPSSQNPPVTTKFVENRFERRSDFWGVGPEFGIDYEYMFCPCECIGPFSIVANARIALLLTHTDAKLHYRTEFFQGGPALLPVEIHIKNEPLWRITQAYDARFALNYDFCWCRFLGNIQFGYEWILYTDAVDSILFYNVAYAGESFDLYNNVSLHGPFVGLSLHF